MRKKTAEQFINEAILKHGTYYNYSKTNYESTHKKVIITCPQHGDFAISPANHLRKQGCHKCGDAKNGISQRKTTDQFISESKGIFGEAYGYEKTNYITNHCELIITCKIHGDFKKKPLKHLSAKQGCPKCAASEAAKNRKVTLESFLKSVELKFGSAFYLPNVSNEYSGIRNSYKLTVICNECKTQYKQSAGIFLKSNGCLNCLMYKFKKPPIGESLGDLYPNSIKLWGNNVKYTPFDFHSNIGRKMNWICPTCNSEYKRTIQKQFLKRQIGCKNCKSRIHYTEKRLLFELKSFYPDAVGDGIGLQIDIFIPSLNLIIEYDGVNWHKGDAKYKKDKVKTDKLISLGYKVIRLRENPLLPITNNDILIDVINLNGNKKTTASIK